MRITESQLRKIVRSLLREDEIPGNSPPEKQLHVFDFDDTLGVTEDSNGVMLYRNGLPAWKTAKEAEDWVKSIGIDGEDLLKGPGGKSFEKPDGMDGFAAYVSSGVLPSIKAAVGGQDNAMYAPEKPGAEKKGEVVVFDFSPSASAKSAKPIKSSLEKVQDLDSKGSKTAIVTARAAENIAQTSPDFSGKEHPVSVQADLTSFTEKQGADMNLGIYGTKGANKGEFIKNTLLPKGDFEEIHFYDDDPTNINKVAGALGDKVDAEVYLYGPGKFQDAPTNSKKPKQTFSPKDRKAESRKRADNFLVERWLRLAGLND